MEQIITGTKIFEQDLIVEGSVTAKRINDKNITMEYDQGVLNDEDIDIHGNLVSTRIFELLSCRCKYAKLKDLRIKSIV